MKLDIYGVLPALVTPFKKDETFDKEQYKELINYLIRKGIHGAISCGTTGEFCNLTLEERKKVNQVAVEEVNNRVPLIVGTGETGTKLTIDMTKHAYNIGANAAIIITPYYLKPKEKGLYNHYAQICAQTDLPLVLYNYPQLTGVTLPHHIVEKLVSEFDQIIAIKDSSGNIDYVMTLLEKVSDTIAVLIGADALVINGLAQGAKGMILTSANVLPEFWIEIYDLLKNNHLNHAFQKQQRMQQLLRMMRESEIVGAKYCLNLRGITVGEPRSPLITGDFLSHEQKEELRSEMKKHGLLN